MQRPGHAPCICAIVTHAAASAGMLNDKRGPSQVSTSSEEIFTGDTGWSKRQPVRCRLKPLPRVSAVVRVKERGLMPLPGGPKMSNSLDEFAIRARSALRRGSTAAEATEDSSAFTQSLTSLPAQRCLLRGSAFSQSLMHLQVPDADGAGGRDKNLILPLERIPSVPDDAGAGETFESSRRKSALALDPAAATFHENLKEVKAREAMRRQSAVGRMESFGSSWSMRKAASEPRSKGTTGILQTSVKAGRYHSKKGSFYHHLACVATITGRPICLGGMGFVHCFPPHISRCLP